MEAQRLEEMMAAKDAEVERVRIEKDQYMALQQEYLKIATDSGFELEKLRLQMTEKGNAKRATEERAKLLQRKLEKEETDRRNERETLVRALEASDSMEKTKRLEGKPSWTISMSCTSARSRRPNSSSSVRKTPSRGSTRT